MAKNVLIITSSIDCTVDYIIQKYRGIIEFYRFNIDYFSKYEVIIGGSNQWSISCDEWKLEKNDLYSIYYRKPRLPNLEEYELAYRSMISKDIISLVNGIVDDFEGKVLTKPCILRTTENKTFQLLYAEKKGLLIPKSCIGNSNKRALSFLDEESIIKPLTTGKVIKDKKVEIYQTNYFTTFENDISLTPIYLQSYERKQYEVRLTYISGSFFAVRIDAEDKLDWRKDYCGLQYSIIECPKIIVSLCTTMLKDFKLNYGAFDFIVNEKDEWIFLEVNPNGQWLWLEQKLEIPISDGIIEYLIE
jgi:hypothetical protein